MSKEKQASFFIMLLGLFMLGGNRQSNHQLQSNDQTPRSFKPERKRQPKPRSFGMHNRYRH